MEVWLLIVYKSILNRSSWLHELVRAWVAGDKGLFVLRDGEVECLQKIAKVTVVLDVGFGDNLSHTWCVLFVVSVKNVKFLLPEINY